MHDFAALLSCGLNVTDSGNYQILLGGNNTVADQLVAVMAPPHSTHNNNMNGYDRNDADGEISLTIPSLQLHQPNNNHSHHPLSGEGTAPLKHFRGDKKTSSKSVLQEAAASNLRVPLTLRGASNIGKAPMILLWNLQNSFCSLVQSRLKSTVQALCAGTATAKNPRSKIIGEVLHPRANPIQPSTMVTSFTSVVGLDTNDNHDSTTTTTTTTTTTSNSQATTSRVSLLFQIVIDFKVLGRIVTVQVQAPASLQEGTLVTRDTHREHSGSVAFQSLHLTVDTHALLLQCMQEIRRLVKRAVSLATQVAACVTQTLPRNAPGGLLQALQQQQYLQGVVGGMANSSALPPVALMLQEEENDNHRQQQRQQQHSVAQDGNTTSSHAEPNHQSDNNSDNNDWNQQQQRQSPLHLFEPVDSTKALEECFTMPPPPARLPQIQQQTTTTTAAVSAASLASPTDRRQHWSSTLQQQQHNQSKRSREEYQDSAHVLPSSLSPHISKAPRKDWTGTQDKRQKRATV